MSDSCFITIFTPSYNRRDRLPRLLESLLAQTSFDFEWLIVDDGSADGTKEYIDGLMDLPFAVRYIWQENKGKHTAINRGVANAKGIVFAIVDSDDYLLEVAVETLQQWFAEIKGRQDFAGVAAQKGYSKSEETGTFYEAEFVDAKSTDRMSLNINGDKFEVFYTAILQAFPFPVFEGEKFLTEAVVWNRIADAGYQLRWHKKILYICEYLENGLTDRKDRLVRQSPRGYALHIREQVERGMKVKHKLGQYSYYYGVRRVDVKTKQIMKELQCSRGFLYASVLLRKLVYLLKR